MTSEKENNTDGWKLTIIMMTCLTTTNQKSWFSLVLKNLREKLNSFISGLILGSLHKKSFILHCTSFHTFFKNNLLTKKRRIRKKLYLIIVFPLLKNNDMLTKLQIERIYMLILINLLSSFLLYLNHVHTYTPNLNWQTQQNNNMQNYFLHLTLLPALSSCCMI